jgi:hypothetical protein
MVLSGRCVIDAEVLEKGVDVIEGIEQFRGLTPMPPLSALDLSCLKHYVACLDTCSCVDLPANSVGTKDHKYRYAGEKPKDNPVCDGKG